VTYGMDKVQAHYPRIAKDVGFKRVVAGIYWFNDAGLAAERAVLDQLEYIDGIVLGNEGIEGRRYTRAALEAELTSLKRATGKPVTTSEPVNQYERDLSLLLLGD
jgi:hypothetical protein